MLFLFSLSIKASCTINCSFRYLYRVSVRQHDINVGTYSGSEIGTTTLFAPGGGLVYGNNQYQNVWTNTYTGNVIFCTGYELNEELGSYTYNDNSIIAIVKWNNGGVSVVTILNWSTKLKYLTEEELLIDNNTGESISGMNGNEKNTRYWEFNF